MDMEMHMHMRMHIRVILVMPKRVMGRATRVPLLGLTSSLNIANIVRKERRLLTVVQAAANTTTTTTTGIITIVTNITATVVVVVTDMDMDTDTDTGGHTRTEGAAIGKSTALQRKARPLFREPAKQSKNGMVYSQSGWMMPTLLVS